MGSYIKPKNSILAFCNIVLVLALSGTPFRNAHAQAGPGVFHSFAAARLSGGNYHLPDSNATMAAFWDATRGNPLGDSSFCASDTVKVLAISLVDSAAIERYVPECSQYSTNGKIVRGISQIQATATLDDQSLEVLRHPNSGAEKFDTIINPNNDSLALASCDELITLSGGVRMKGDQCYGVTFVMDVSDLTAGEHALTFELTAPDPVCGGAGVFTSTVTIDSSC